MFNNYPLPAQACAMWTAGDVIWIAFPPAPGSDKGHCIHLPRNEHGIKYLLKLMDQREIIGPGCIGSKSAPMQSQIKITEIVKVTVTQEAIDFDKAEAAAASRKRQRGSTDLSVLDLEDLGL